MLRQGFGFRVPPPRLVPDDAGAGGGLDRGAGATAGADEERPEEPLPLVVAGLSEEPPLPRDEPPDAPDPFVSTEGAGFDPPPLPLPETAPRSR